MAKREKSEKQLANEALTKVFKATPVEEWADYISANAEGEAQTRTFRVCAKKALSIENMMAYISAHDNKQASKKAFAQASYGIQYQKTTDANGKKDFVKEPGLHRTMFGDGLACLAASLIGGPPVTTYSEVTGAMQITRVTHPQVIRIAAATAIVFSVIGKLSAVLKSIPNVLFAESIYIL